MTFYIKPAPRGRQQNTRPKRWARAVQNGLYAIEFIRGKIPDEVSQEVDEANLDDNFSNLFPPELRPDITTAMSTVEDSKVAIEDLQGEYKDWRQNLADNLQGSATAQLCESIEEMDIPELDRSTLEEMENFFNEADGMDLPRGYGKD